MEDFRDESRNFRQAMQHETRRSNDNAMMDQEPSDVCPTVWGIDTRVGADARLLAETLLKEHFGGELPAAHAGIASDLATGRPLASAPWLSWSRTHGAALAMLDTDGPVGCDVERVREIDVLAMVRTIGSESERDWFRIHDEPLRTRAFFRLWTAKEAVLKAAGTGFRHDARRLSVAADLLDATAREAVIEACGAVWSVSLRTEGPFQMAFARQRRT